MLEVLRRLESSNGSEMVESSREEIRDAAYKLEDAVEFHVSDLFLSQSDESLGDEGSNPLILSPDLDGVQKQEIHYFADMVRKMEEACSKPLDLEPLIEEEDDVDAKDGMESKMVGLEFQHVKDKLLSELYLSSIASISGMGGIGKTTLARKICQDPEVLNYFDCCLWVTIGSKFQFRKVMLRILAQLDHDVDSIQKEGDDKLVKYLYTSLENKRYLIVLDDLWREEDWDELKKFGE